MFVVYYENHMERINNALNPVRTLYEIRLRYKALPVNAVQGNSRCLLWEQESTQIIKIQFVSQRKHIMFSYKAPSVNAV
jgi:uncharacterized protein YfaA (DUF2138 family)